MTNQDPAKTDAKISITPKDDAAPKVGESPEDENELTDAEVAAVAGGHSQWLVPPKAGVSFSG